MEDSWLLSTTMQLNANTPTLETKETKTQKELYIVINEMTINQITNKMTKSST